MTWNYTDMKKLEWEYNAFDSPKVCYSNGSIFGEAMEKFNSLIFLLLNYCLCKVCKSWWISMNSQNQKSTVCNWISK